MSGESDQPADGVHEDRDDDYIVVKDSIREDWMSVDIDTPGFG